MIPLSEEMRPKILEDIVGQDNLVGPQGILTSIIQSGKPLSIILWGPPGCGKTSIARLYAKAFNMRFEVLSAIFSGIADLKKIIKDTEATPLLGQQTLLFVDEIHRFNKAQQDAFLPFIEKGTIVLVGATAENPSFYLNGALLSRVRVCTLKALDPADLEKIIQRYETSHQALNIEQEARALLIDWAQGDARYLLNLIESIESVESSVPLSVEKLQQLLQKRAPLFDKGGDQHYNLISALHKSVRGSDPDAALYWFSRMLTAGEDPLFLARRVIRMASEDVGLADPQALTQAIAARDAYEMLGSPEGELAIAQAIVYIALAPKSNSLYKAYNAARESAAATTHLNPPPIILNAPTLLMKQIGYGKGYIYDHDTAQGFSGQNYFPEQMQRQRYYTPVERGFEREMQKRITYFNHLRDSQQDA